MSQLAETCVLPQTYRNVVQTADRLEATWFPTGYYTPDEMAKAIVAAIRLAKVGSDAAVQFFSGSSTPGAKARVRAAADAYFAVAKRANDYVETVREAERQGAPKIYSPGFKQWVIDDLRAGAALFKVILTEECNKPWWVGPLLAFGQATTAFADAVVGTGKAVLNAGEQAIKAIGDAFDIAGFLLRVLPFVALGLGGYYLYRRYTAALPPGSEG